MENLLIIGLSAAVFTAVIIGLVAIITVLERKLVAQGSVRININDNEEKSIDVAAGSNLLSALSEAGIYLPSACGGGGTCAMCRCQITDGGGDILPTEEGHFSRKEIKESCIGKHNSQVS